MKQWILVLALLLQGTAFAEFLPSGTPVQVVIDKEIDADDVKVGDIVTGHILTAVKAGGTVVIPAGLEVKGVVTRRKNNGICGIPGSLEIGSFKIYTSSGDIIPLNGGIQRKGDSRIAGSLVGAYFLFLPIFIKGQDGIIENGTETTMYTVQEWEYK